MGLDRGNWKQAMMVENFSKEESFSSRRYWSQVYNLNLDNFLNFLYFALL